MIRTYNTHAVHTMPTVAIHADTRCVAYRRPLNGETLVRVYDGGTLRAWYRITWSS